jgi:hypothetical protein
MAAQTGRDNATNRWLTPAIDVNPDQRNIGSIKRRTRRSETHDTPPESSRPRGIVPCP